VEVAIEILRTLTPIIIGIIGLIGFGAVGKIILKVLEYRNDEKIRKEKKTAIINSNFSFYMKLFDKLAENARLWQNKQIELGNINSVDYSIKMSVADFDAILEESIVDFNNENGYLDIEEQLKLKMPLQSRGFADGMGV
jgi:homoserine dehydrogenase